MSRTIIGVDPGASGALALLTFFDPESLAAHIDVRDMPTHFINGKRRIDLHTLVLRFQEWRYAHADIEVWVENVGAMPGQSPNGMFQFGFACAAVQTAIVAAGIPMKLVTPQVWKKHYGLRGGPENKDASRQAASRLFPQHAGLWARKKDDGRAEAVLIANYGRFQ